MNSLEDLQKRFQGYVTGKISRAACKELSKEILPNHSLGSLERVDIYKEMYPLRMAEALESDYPALKAYFGPKKFRKLVDAYIQKYPSRSYTLNRLGDSFLKFVKKSRLSPFVTELVELEVGICKAFDAEEVKTLTGESFSDVSGVDWLSMRLAPVPASSLHAFTYSVNEVLTALKWEKPVPKVRRKKTYVMVVRESYSVWRWDLNRAEYEILKALYAGKTVSEALSRGLPYLVGKNPIEEVQAYFRNWVGRGVFRKETKHGKSSSPC